MNTASGGRASDPDQASPIAAWFGEGFAQLHPGLQRLHREGGCLEGTATLRFGAGLAGRIGQRLARRLGFPDTAGDHRLAVTIRHEGGVMHWIRRFDGRREAHSTFRPAGHWPEGHLVEHTGPVELWLRVDTAGGAWRWLPIRARVLGVRVPLWLLPLPAASKRIEDGRYRFEVSIALPFVGEVLGYRGLLDRIDP